MWKCFVGFAVIVGAACVAGLAGSPVYAQATGSLKSDPPPPALPLPVPSWYTEALHARILAAGPHGVEVPLDHDAALEPNCLGVSPASASTSTTPPLAAVSAGGCMVHPHGCTMNFIFTDGAARYIGTAGHCVDKGGDVVMQVATRVDPTNTVMVTLAKIGRVAKRVNSGIGRDFGLVKIDPGWPVVSGVAGAAGPTGVLCLDPVGQPVVHYGHGYIFFVEQGYPKAGEVIVDLDVVFKGDWANGYNWVGYGLPGDSGSPVMNGAGLAVGNLSHGIGIAGLPVPGLNMGTTITGIFGIIGSQYSLVTVDGRAVKCGSLPVGL